MKPGEDLIIRGLLELAERKETVASLLVSIGAPRLRLAGLTVPDFTFPDPEHRLYRLLSSEDEDSAHSRYNSLIRRLVSYEQAAECAT